MYFVKEEHFYEEMFYFVCAKYNFVLFCFHNLLDNCEWKFEYKDPQNTAKFFNDTGDIMSEV